MGHIPLAKYLFCIGKAPSGLCPSCQQEVKMVQHFILHCPAHERARQTLHYKTGGGFLDIKQMLTKAKPMKALVKFVATTGWLDRHVQRPDEPDLDPQDWQDNPCILNTSQPVHHCYLTFHFSLPLSFSFLISFLLLSLFSPFIYTHIHTTYILAVAPLNISFSYREPFLWLPNLF